METLFRDDSLRVHYHIIESESDVELLQGSNTEGFETIIHMGRMEMTEILRKWIKRGDIISVVTSNDRVVGYSRFDIKKKEETRDHKGNDVVISRAVYQLRNMDIKKEYRRKGIGVTLATFTFPHLHADIVVFPMNQRMKRYLQERLGFVEAGLRFQEFKDHLFLPYPKAATMLTRLVSSRPKKFLPTLMKVHDELHHQLAEEGETSPLLNKMESELGQLKGKSATRTFLSLARLCKMVGDIENAELYYTSAIHEAERMDNLKAYFDTLEELARMFYDHNRIDECEKLYHELQDKAIIFKDPESEAEGIKGLGIVSWRRGEIDVAESIYNAGLEKLEGKISKRKMASFMVNLGTLKTDQGDHREARKMYKQALRDMEEAGDIHGMAMVWNNLAEVDIRRGKGEKAVTNATQALMMARSIGDTMLVSYLHITLAEALLMVGDVDEAEDELYDAEEEFSRLKGTYGLLLIKLMKGIIARERDELRRSSIYLDDAVEGFEKEQIPSGLAKAYIERAETRKLAAMDGWEEDLDQAHLLATHLKSKPYLDRLDKLGHQLEDEELPWL